MFWRHRTVPPSEFALLIAIPLDRDEFAAAEACRTDFVENYAEGAQKRGDALWAAYKRYATLCTTIVDDVAHRGVTVTRRATLSAFADAAATHRVVTIVAHARGPEIAARDIQRIDVIRSGWDRLCEAVGADVVDTTDASQVAAALNAALGPSEVAARGRSETEDFAARVACYRARWDRRRIVQQICGGAVTGGPAIEFADGLTPIETVRDRLPAFQIMDLTVCDSVLLAECIRERHQHGVVLANPRPTTPDFRLALYGEAIRHIARHGKPYPETAIRLRRALMR